MQAPYDYFVIILTFSQRTYSTIRQELSSSIAENNADGGYRPMKGFEVKCNIIHFTYIKSKEKVQVIHVINYCLPH